jgi:hypothetical protein
VLQRWGWLQHLFRPLLDKITPDEINNEEYAIKEETKKGKTCHVVKIIMK